MSNAKLRLHLPCLKAFSLSFDPEGWFKSPAWNPEWLVNTHSLFDNLDMPLLEHITYDAFVDFLPLLGLLHRIGNQITHLSVTHFEVPTELIECLKACPHLVSLNVSRPGVIPEAKRQQYQQLTPTGWATSLSSWTTAGNKLLRYLMRAGDIDDMIQTQLCPHLEHLDYRIGNGPMSCDAIRAFILDKSQTGADVRMKSLSTFICDGPENVEFLCYLLEKQLLAGLCLQLLPGASKYMEHNAHPVMRQLEWWKD